jgi:putative oxidoreductase
MKITSTIARYVLGLIFTVFGLNGFLHFIPVTPVPPLASQFFGVLAASHYVVPIFVLQLVCGLVFLTHLCRWHSH